MIERQLKEKFLADSRCFLQEINEIMIGLDSRFDEELVNEAFRIMHSMKSEALYLNEKPIAEAAHKAEQILKEFKLNPGKQDLLYSIYPLLEAVQKRLSELNLLELGTYEWERTKQESEKNQDSLDTLVENPKQDEDFSDFERKLIYEAKYNGDILKKLSIAFEEDTPLKYSKTVLIVSKLEELVNVIKVFPSVHEKLNDEAYEHFSVVFSGTCSLRTLFNSVYVDQLKKAVLSKLGFHSIFDKPNLQTQSFGRAAEYIHVDHSRVDAIMSYLEELKLRIHTIKNQGDRADSEFLKLQNLSVNMETALRKVRMVNLENAFSGLQRIVLETAKRLGKECYFEFDVKDVEIDRKLMDKIYDPLIQLLENAVIHGIENPEQRVLSNKARQGKISLHVRFHEGTLLIKVTDDGKGIDRNQLKQYLQKKELNLLFSDQSQIKDILTYPGFSTIEGAGLQSGRGIGLDLVNKRIKAIPNAEFLLDFETGIGSTFILKIPNNETLKNLSFFQSKDRVLAFETDKIVRTFTVDKEQVLFNREKGISVSGMPAYNEDGLLLFESVISQLLAVQIDTAHGPIIMLFDKFLYKQDILADEYNLSYMPMSPLKKLNILNTDFQIYFVPLNEIIIDLNKGIL